MAPETVATAQKRKSPDQETAEAGRAAAAALCANGCGFFGTAANKGMCSKCYRKHHPADTTAACKEEKADRAASAFTVPPPLKKIKLSVPSVASSSDTAAAAAAVDTSSPANEPQQPSAPAKPATANRCLTCRKKVGLTGFQCRCGGTFCGTHRYSDAHSCGFDYKAAGRQQIAKQNPLVVAAKI